MKEMLLTPAAARLWPGLPPPPDKRGCVGDMDLFLDKASPGSNCIQCEFELPLLENSSRRFPPAAKSCPAHAEPPTEACGSRAGAPELRSKAVLYPVACLLGTDLPLSVLFNKSS